MEHRRCINISELICILVAEHKHTVTFTETLQILVLIEGTIVVSKTVKGITNGLEHFHCAQSVLLFGISISRHSQCNICCVCFRHMNTNERVYQSVFINLLGITNLLQDNSAEFVIFTSIHPCSLCQELVNGQTNLTEAING